MTKLKMWWFITIYNTFIILLWTKREVLAKIGACWELQRKANIFAMKIALSVEDLTKLPFCWSLIF